MPHVRCGCPLEDAEELDLVVKDLILGRPEGGGRARIFKSLAPHGAVPVARVPQFPTACEVGEQ